jgi:hypothetical protein
MNSSGMSPLTFDLGLSLGGVGLLEYSVKLNVLMLGVLGLELAGVPLPLTLTPFSIFRKIMWCGLQLLFVVFVVGFV